MLNKVDLIASDKSKLNAILAKYSNRLCIKYRELNANTLSDKYPLLLISDQIDRLRGGKYFSSLDMSSGFYQVPIHPDSVKRTAFVTPEDQYDFLAMPFGLKNASSVFQRAIVRALGNLVNTYAVVYIDDELHMDASAKSYGAMLLHKVERKPRVVEYYSNCTT